MHRISLGPPACLIVNFVDLFRWHRYNIVVQIFELLFRVECLLRTGFSPAKSWTAQSLKQVDVCAVPDHSSIDVQPNKTGFVINTMIGHYVLSICSHTPYKSGFMVALSVPIFWRPESDGHGDDGCSTTFWRCHFFDRNGMLTPKDQYLFRWVETTNQKVWGTLRDATASLGLHWTWPEFERSAVWAELDSPQDSQKLAEWKTCLSAVTLALWQHYMIL